MNSRVLLLLSAVAAVALSTPLDLAEIRKSNAQVRGDNCGAVSLASAFFTTKWNNKDLNDLLCPICLDLVQLGENYLECGEGAIGDALDKDCEKIHSSFLKDACLDIVNDIVKELENDSEPDPSKICTKLLKATCAPKN